MVIGGRDVEIYVQVAISVYDYVLAVYKLFPLVFLPWFREQDSFESIFTGYSFDIPRIFFSSLPTVTLASNVIITTYDMRNLLMQLEIFLSLD